MMSQPFYALNYLTNTANYIVNFKIRLFRRVLQNLYVLLFCFPPYTCNREDTVWKTVQVLKSPSTASDT